MNAFRFLGDMSHTASILILLLKLRASKSAAGEGRKDAVKRFSFFVPTDRAVLLWPSAVFFVLQTILQ